MNIFITILLIIAAIIAIFFIIALFTKKGYSLEREITINKSTGDVFNYIRHLKNQDYYSKWVMMDPNVKRTGTGADGTMGFVSAWDSNVRNVGKGEQEITKIIPGARIDSKVRFEKPFKNVADVNMATKAIAPEQTELIWTMRGQNKYPMNIMNLFIPGMLAKDMAESLENLKGVLEKGG